MSRARSAAPSSDWSSTPAKRVSRCVESSPLVSSVATSSSSAALRSASSPSVRRLLLSISATASASERPWVSNWLASCDRSLSVSSDIDWKLAMLRSTSLLAEPVFLRHVVHGRDEIGHPCDQRALDLAHVLVRAAEHLLQQDVGLAQALEQRGRIRPQHVLRLEHLGDRGRGGLLGLLDRRLGRVLQLLERARDRLRRALGRELGGLAQLLDRTVTASLVVSVAAMWLVCSSFSD